MEILLLNPDQRSIRLPLYPLMAFQIGIIWVAAQICEYQLRNMQSIFSGEVLTIKEELLLGAPTVFGGAIAL